MISLIDPTKPTTINPKFSDVRANFAAAKAEIESLQGAVSGLVDGSLAVTPLMYGGFNEDIVYNTGDNKVPDFLTDADGDLYYY